MRVGLAATVACWLGVAGSAQALPPCAPAALNALLVANLTITAAQPAPDGALGYCDLHARLQIAGTSADLRILLPDRWEQRLLQVQAGDPAFAATRLEQGYAVAVVPAGQSADIWHVVAETARELVRSYYAAPVSHSYAVLSAGQITAAGRYPTDYDGVVLDAGQGSAGEIGDGLSSFFKQGRKMLVDAGPADVAAGIALYSKAAQDLREQSADSVRLFLLPRGVAATDLIAPLATWVEQNQPPAFIVPTRDAAPVCPYPAVAESVPGGTAESVAWRCDAPVVHSPHVAHKEHHAVRHKASRPARTRTASLRDS